MRGKSKLWKRVLGGLIVVIVIIAIIVTVILNNTLGKMDKVQIDKDDLELNTDEIEEKYLDKDKENEFKLDAIKNIALFGVDAEEGQAGRSDSIMIATIDSNNNKLKLTSIMRDSYVNIPDIGMDKINHAYAYGQEQLAVKTINSNFGLNIEDYVTVNFSSLPKIIDLLGGVEINITEEEVPLVPGVCEAGTQNLTGDQALSYARIRYASGNDFKRTERHRTILTALFKKFLKMPATSYLSLTNELLPYVQTNLSTADILSLATNVVTMMDDGGFEQERFPLDGYCEDTYIDGVYYLSFDINETKEFIMDYIYSDKKDW